MEFPTSEVMSDFVKPQIQKDTAWQKKLRRAKRQPTEQETVFTSYTSEERLISRTYKELHKLNTKEIKLSKWTNELNK